MFIENKKNKKNKIKTYLEKDSAVVKYYCRKTGTVKKNRSKRIDI